MKFEPLLYKPALLETIRKAYGYPVQKLAFVPEGYVGQHYVAGCADGKQYFVTLLNDSRLARLCIATLDFTLPLTRGLYDRALFRALAKPLPTLGGALRADFQGCTLVVYEYIQGNSLIDSYPYPPALLARLGGLTARLHACTPHIGMEIPCKETFTLPFEGELLAGLSALKKGSGLHRRGQIALRELLVPRHELILGLLSRLHKLAGSARLLNPAMVLCHTDITPLNIIQTPLDELVLVDWEGAMLAPAEADLCLFTGEAFPVFLEEYCRLAGQPRLDGNLFAFYMLRRNLVDLTDCIVLILHENTADEQDQGDLTCILEDCIPGLSNFDSAAGLVREQLQAVKRNATFMSPP